MRGALRPWCGGVDEVIALCYHAFMGQILIRNLDDAVIQRYKSLATLNGRSLEAEVRAALESGGPATPEEKMRLSKRARALTANRPGSIEGWRLINEERDKR
jgi:antitoxin FitA